MASSKTFKDFVLEQLVGLPIVAKPMMGEFLIYYNDKLIGGIFDNRFMLKKTETNKRYDLSEEVPYPSGKPMYVVDVENKEILFKIVDSTYQGIK